MIRIISLLLLVLSVAGPQPTGSAVSVEHVVDDFESYAPGGIPDKWSILRGRKLTKVQADYMLDDEWFKVTREGGNQALRVYSNDAVATLAMPTDEESEHPWDFAKTPGLSWDWRAFRLPEGASEDEDRLNDSGMALYVFFAIRGRMIKRPEAIKYTYSATLPVGTVVDYGRLKVIVVSSALDGLGEWQHIERNVVADYRQQFGDEPPAFPLLIRLWSDTDNLGGVAEGEYDNIRIR